MCKQGAEVYCTCKGECLKWAVLRSGLQGISGWWRPLKERGKGALQLREGKRGLTLSCTPVQLICRVAAQWCC